MVCHPLLDNQAIGQEVAVIDAEYQLLQRHQPSRIEAALLHAAASPAEFHRFHIGSRASFGDELSALQRALRQFHQRYYFASNMRLWLQGRTHWMSWNSWRVTLLPRCPLVSGDRICHRRS